MINNSKIILNFTIIYKHHQNKLNLHFLLTIWYSAPAKSTFVLVQFLFFLLSPSIFFNYSYICIYVNLQYFSWIILTYFFYLGTWCYVFYFYTGTNKFGWIWHFLLTFIFENFHFFVEIFIFFYLLIQNHKIFFNLCNNKK